MNNKLQLRLHAKSIRKTLDINNISKIIINKIINSEFFKSAENVMIFYPLENEIDLLELLKIENKNFYLPKIEGDNLVVCPYKIGEELDCGEFNTKEPITPSINPQILDLIFVPALLVDENNNRLGYGKGFYDRFLTNCQAKTVVAIPSQLVVDKIPTEIHDKPINLVVTEANTFSKKLILASSSPRRREALEKLNLNFEIIKSPYVEEFDHSNFSYELIENLAFEKANAVLPSVNKGLVIGADTVVILDNKILGKPLDFQDAKSMLQALSAKKHFVVTSICVINSENKACKKVSTTSFVEFNELSDKMIEDYINNFKPYDKAGSYGIQELPPSFIKNINGSFDNIVGLCPNALIKLLQEF